MVLRCINANDTLKIKNAVNEKFGETYDVSLPTLKKPRLKITNIDENLSDDNIISELKRFNNQINDCNIQLIARIKRVKRGFTFNDIIVEVDSVSQKKMIEFGTLYLPWRECKVYEHIYLKRCYKCCGFSHTSIECKNNQFCSKCSGQHKFSECNNNKVECINCKIANYNFKTNLNINHHAWSKECAVLQRRMVAMKNKIEYNENE